jgi:hypothetical protein
VPATPTPQVVTEPPSSRVLLPATFTVRQGGALIPPTVSAPASVTVVLTVVSGDGRAHRAVLETPTPHTLTVPASGRASVSVPGLRAGRYRVEIDGVVRGALVMGVKPGP